MDDIPLIDPPLRSMTLADGRRLTWQEFGAPDGRPALYFHGGGSTSPEAGIFHREAVRRNVRLIATNRPGARGSTLRPGRPVAAYSDDLRELLDSLDIETFACFGESNGGMVTMAVAATMPARVRVLCPSIPPSRGSTRSHGACRHRRRPWGIGCSGTHPRSSPGSTRRRRRGVCGSVPSRRPAAQLGARGAAAGNRTRCRRPPPSHRRGAGRKAGAPGRAEVGDLGLGLRPLRDPCSAGLLLRSARRPGSVRARPRRPQSRRALPSLLIRPQRVLAPRRAPPDPRRRVRLPRQRTEDRA